MEVSPLFHLRHRLSAYDVLLTYDGAMKPRTFVSTLEFELKTKLRIKTTLT